MNRPPGTRSIIVTMEVEYVVPMLSETESALSGRPIEEVAKDWFENYDINSYHATRDAHRLGNGTVVTGYRVV